VQSTSHTLPEAALESGLDAAQVRFLTPLFADLLPGARRVHSSFVFDRDAVETLRLVREFVFQCGFSLDEAHSEIRALRLDGAAREERICSLA
jgi:hypothetical protein